MVTLIADDIMQAVLNQARGLAEIRDSQGILIGVFARVSNDPAEPGVRVAPWGPRPSLPQPPPPADPRGYTLREVFEYLLTLADDEESRADLRRHIDKLTRREQGLEEEEFV
jgi:hypothetical protein